jgi:hypothetical protein
LREMKARYPDTNASQPIAATPPAAAPPQASSQPPDTQPAAPALPPTKPSGRSAQNGNGPGKGQPSAKRVQSAQARSGQARSGRAVTTAALENHVP